jgi:16S rRNA (cytosine967-C5)-methyltransferase
MSEKPQNSAAPRPPPTARDLASRVLLRVEGDGAFAAPALDAELDRHPALDPRERRLTTELVYGVIRTRGALMRRLLAHAPRGLSDPHVTTELLLAAYQLLLLDRIPAHAAVDAAVSAVTRKRGTKVGGFANALLRRLAREDDKLDLRGALITSLPEWLWQRLSAAVGREEAEALLGVAGDIGKTWVRVRDGVAEQRAAWLASADSGALSRLSRLAPAGDPEKLPGFTQGDFVVQEQGAQFVALALGVRPGERVLDACAGRGQKTSLFVEQSQPGGSVFASDVHPKKLERLKRELERLQLPSVETAAVDLRLGVGTLPDDFDRVIVDAPCTGVGTLRRRPEIGQRLTPDDPARMGALAAEILRGAATRARPSGRVVFAVCSVLPEECEAVVESVRDVLEPAPFDAPEVVERFGSTSSFRITPKDDGVDGYFVASFLRL